MKYHTIEFHGALNFRFTTLDVVAIITYGDEYLDICELWVQSERRDDLVLASERLTVEFQERHWNFLESYCRDHCIAMAEYYRDMRREEAVTA